MTIIALWIILGIIAFVVIMLHFSLRVQLDADKTGAEIKIKYLFFTIYPRSPKKVKTGKIKTTVNKIDKAEKTDASSEKINIDEFKDSLDDELGIKNDEPENVENLTAKAETVHEETVGEDFSNVDEQTLSDKTVEAEKSEPVKKIKRVKKKKQKTADKPKKKGIIAKIKEQYNKYKPYIPMSWKYFKKLLKTIRFTDTKISVTVGWSDAYHAALLYGKTQRLVFGIVTLLSQVFTVKLKKCDVNCNFDELDLDGSVHTVVKIRPSALIAIAFCMGVKFLSIYLPERLRKKRMRKKAAKMRAKRAKKTMNNKTIENSI